MNAIFGRDDELDNLVRFLDAVPMGPSAMVLQGEAGIGKSTLWNAGIALAAERSYRVLSCRAAESEARSSYAALADLLGEAFDDAEGLLPDVQRRALEVAFVRLEPEGPLAERTVATAALGVLRAVAANGPVLVAVDDDQWIDAPSAAVVAFCVRRIEQEPVGILTASRVGEGVHDPFGLDGGLRAARPSHVRVGPLAIEAIGSLIAEQVAIRPGRPVLRHLYEVCGGNPFFAIELARAVRDSGRTPGPGEMFPAPEDLRDLLRSRLAAVPPSVRGVLLVAAAAQRPTAPLVVSAQGPRSVPALERASRAGLVEVVGEEVRFVHPLFASAVYLDASGEARRDAHRRLADVVPDIEERARHLALSTSEPDANVAAALEKAARGADERGAPAGAAELCGLALSLTPFDRHADRRRLQLSSADYSFRAGDLRAAADILESLVAASPPGADRAQALVRLGQVHLEDDLDAAVSALTAAIDEDGTPLTVRQEAHGNLSTVVLNLGRLEEALRHGVEAIALAEETGDALRIADALQLAAEPHLFLGRGFDDADLARAERLAGDPRDWSPVYYQPSVVRAILLSVLDRNDEAREIFEALLEASTERGDEPSTWFVHGWLARVEGRAGRWEEALGHAAASERDAPGQLLLAHRGELDAAETSSSAALAEADRSGHISDLFDSLETLGAIELLRGNPQRAHHYLGKAWGLFVGTGAKEPNKAPFLPDEIDALIRLGELDAAEHLTSWLEERGREFDRPRALATSLRCRGLLLDARGDRDGAVDALEAALLEHERFEAPFELGRTLLALGSVRRRARQKRGARDDLERALEIFGQLGAIPWMERTKGELASIGGRPRATGGLSATEQRVARLAAAGRTNSEIADAMFISTRTVAGHLSHVYRKLEVRSRTELAAVIAEGAGPPVFEADKNAQS